MKQTINRFNYAALRNEAHVQMHDSFIALVGKYNAEELGIKAVYDQYLLLFEKEKAVLDVILKSSITAELDAQDQVRDRLFRGFADAVKSALNHFDDGKREAAEKLNLILKHYGNISNRPMDQETAAIEDLNRELNEPQNAAHVAALSLGDWLTALLAANAKFDEMMMARYAEVSQRPNVNMRECRAAVDKLFRAMLDLLDALMLVNGADKYTAFISELNAITKHYENILAQQKGARAAKKGDTENASQTN